MKVYTIVRTFFDADDNWEQTAVSDTYRDLRSANDALLGIIESLMDTGVQYVGTYTLDYLARTMNANEKHATLEYPNGRSEVIAVKINWLY